MDKITSFRLSKEAVVFINRFSKEKHESKGEVLRELMENGRIMVAIIMYKKNKVSMGKASEIAGVSISEFMDILSEFRINSNLTLEDYRESLKSLKKIWKLKN